MRGRRWDAGPLRLRVGEQDVERRVSQGEILHGLTFRPVLSMRGLCGHAERRAYSAPAGAGPSQLGNLGCYLCPGIGYGSPALGYPLFW